VNRRGVSWLVSVSLAPVGSLTAHILGLLPHTVEGPAHLEAGSEPTVHLPLVAGLATAIVLIGLANPTWNALRRRPQSVSAAWFVAVPPLGWALQEATERRLGVESFPFHAAREPAFLTTTRAIGH
jgi:hypothetical protein